MIITADNFNLIFATGNGTEASNAALKAQLNEALSYLQKSPKGVELLNSAVQAGVTIRFRDVDPVYHSAAGSDLKGAYPSKTIDWDYTKGLVFTNEIPGITQNVPITQQGVISPALLLAHEFGHVVDLNFATNNTPNSDVQYGTLAERYSTENWEKPIASQLGELIRNNHIISSWTNGDATLHTVKFGQDSFAWQKSVLDGKVTITSALLTNKDANYFSAPNLGAYNAINNTLVMVAGTKAFTSSDVQIVVNCGSATQTINGKTDLTCGDGLFVVAKLDSNGHAQSTQSFDMTTGQAIDYQSTTLPTTSAITTTTTTTAPSITQTGTANEGAAATNVNNGIAVSSGVKTVSFSNGELNSTGTYATIIAAMTTGGIRPGNFSVLPDGSVAPIPSLLISNPAQFTNVTVANTNGGSNYTVNNYGVVIPNILNSTRTYVDPLILDLNNDGVQLTSYADRTVLFDIDHDGLNASGKTTLEQTGWVKANTTTGQTYNTDGILVHDLNGNGKIDGIHETLSEFYNGAAGTNGNAGEKKYTDGFDALKKSLDKGNGTVGSAGYNDNVFDNKDAAYTQLRVWIDANADGITDAGELKTLSELNITSINLNATTQSGLVNGGNEILATGNFTQAGQTKQAQAINFVANTAGSSFTNVTGGVVIDSQAGETGQTTSTYSHTATTAGVLDAATLKVKNIYGGAGNDTITGDANANWLGGGAGADTMSAGAGDDVLLIDANDISIDGGDGNDIAQVIGDTGVTLNLAQSHIEAVVGGRGNDILIGGGRSSVFITANDGDDIVIGGAANDVLSGENGSDLVDGGAGNDLIRGGRGRDQLIGGSGDDILDGNQDDDVINGGDGNDVLNGGQGDDQLDGGLGNNLAEFSGSYADYRITKVNGTTYRVTDLLGRDGTDTLTNIQKLSFKDVSWVDPDLASPLPVKDILDVSSTGAAFNRTSAQIISKAQLLGNDIDRQGDVLRITAVSDFQGGTAVINANGDVQFTPDANYKGIMGFKYSVADAANNVTQVTLNGATAAMKAAVYLRTPDIPKDPLAVDQWYLSEANIIPVWQDYTGKGVKIAMYEPGGEFSVGPEILDMTHPDLKPNLDASWLSNPNNNISQAYSNHATLVAGVIVGARNGEGGVGVAYDAKISGHYLPNLNVLDQALSEFKNYDVVNNSWGYGVNFGVVYTPVGLLPNGIQDALVLGRNGLGTNIVMAGGNDRQKGGNTNTNTLTANRGVIVAGGINASTDLGSLQIGGSPFSNPGASILVSAPASNIASSSRLIESSNGSTFGSDNSVTQGTSFAAPIISGIVALILEANPTLGWRDIQQILAITAKKVNDASTDTVWNTANNWNGGGMHTSHDYGFGEVDARAAVRLAETWVGGGGIHASYNERHLANAEGSLNGAANLNLAVTDGASITRTLAIGAGIRAEHVTVSLDINHSNWGDLTVELISPTGTISKLIANPGTYAGKPGGDIGNGQLTFAMDTTHSLGESAQGNWQLKITDRAGLGVGTLYGWKVDVYGSDYNEIFSRVDTAFDTTPLISATADNVYYFTDEFATAPGVARATLNDANGGTDIINGSAVSAGMTIDLTGATASNIAGRSLTINGNIEHAVGGDGNDVFLGNALNNTLIGGRGNDRLAGGVGNDILDGGAGRDALAGGAGNDTLFFDDEFGQINMTTGILDAGMLGGLDADLFVLQKNTVTPETIQTISFLSNGAVLYGATNLIGDFSVTQDKIDLRNYTSVTNFANLVFTQSYTDGNTGNFASRITLGTAPNAPVIHLYNVSFGNLTVSNFIFASPTVINPVTPPPTVLVGDSGGNVLNGTTGSDTMTGRTGDDTYIVDNAGDDVVELAGGGYDAVESSVTHTLRDNVEQLTLTGSAVINGTGNNDANRIVGNSGNNTLDGKGGSDDLRGGAGNDTYIVDAGTDRVTENTNEGTDTVQSSVSWTLGANLENLTLTGVDNINATGNQLVNILIGNAADNILDGAQGVDNMQGGAGNDTYYVDNASDAITETAGNGYDTVYSSVTFSLNTTAGRQQVEQLILAVGATQGTGNALDNVLIGNDAANTLSGLNGADYLDGGLGADNMTGGLGNDTYVRDNASDVITETSTLITEIDTVLTNLTYTLGTNLENLTLTGTAAINGTGNALANVLTSNSAINTLTGGLGNDTYVVDNTGDIVSETSTLATEIDTVQSSATYTLSANVENLTLTGTTAINGTGNGLNNVLTGNASNNTLNGAAGTDTLNGGFGDDTYVVDTTTDVINEAAGAGADTVQSSVTFSIASIANVENITLTGTAAINATGNALDNVLTGNSAINTLTGGTGNDTYVVDNTGDIVSETSALATEIDTVQSSATYTLSANVENLTLTGTAAINGTGNTLANTLTGNSGNNTLDGGAGIDTMIGGLGNDTYVVDILGDVVTESSTLATEIDTVQSSITYTLGSNLENLTLTGAAAISGTGNTLANTIVGNSGNNTLNGGAGNDTMDGGAGIDALNGGTGNDIYLVDTTTDVITEAANQGTDTIQSSVTFSMAAIANVENLTLTGTAAINATGNALDNVLTGNSAVNTLAGGTGNDTYVVDSTADIISEAASAGTDTVQSSVTFSLAAIANVENITLTGTTAINATGNTLDNVLTGNSAVNTLAGGTGNDTYVVDSTADIISEAASAGTDTVQSSVTFSIASIANVENLTLTGTPLLYATNINGTGNALANTLTGSAGNNILDGGAGIDTLNGSYGDDTYVVDTTTDVINESFGEGTDTIQSSVTFSLAAITADVENITLTGTSAINATGNALNNVLTGNSAVNTLAGGTGNDTYVVDSTADIISEAASAGADTVQSSVTFSLAAIANVENVTLTGTAAINATGNALDNVLTGNSAVNTLAGGTGNDTYVVDLTATNALQDTVTEAASAGNDTLMLRGGAALATATTFTLVGTQLENLDVSLTGATLINLTGNTGDNKLVGNGADNILNGDAGADTLTGGAGTDTLIGGTGNDTYEAGEWSGFDSLPVDVIVDDGNSTADTLKLQIMPNGGYTSISLSREVNDLLINGYMSSDGPYSDYYEGVRIQNQFSGGIYGIENVIHGDGTALTMSNFISSIGYYYNGSAGNDTMSDANALSINGLAGDDSITGSARADVLYGGDGNDTLIGGVGDDYLSGDNGNDVLNGGIGNDTLYGGAGDDVFEFGRGYGIDTANDIPSEKSTIKMVGIASTDTNLRFERILLNPLSSYSTTDKLALKITLVDTGESITFRDWWDPTSDNTNKFVQFSDVTLNLTDIESRISIIAATSGQDFIIGTSQNDNINGGAGHDRIYGLGGNDILNGGIEGADKLYGGLGNDQLIGSSSGTNSLYGEEGNDQLFGNSSNSTLDGGEGADMMTAVGSNNRFYVDNIGDQVTGSGVIYSRLANYTMQANSLHTVIVENGADRNVTGNVGDNYIVGNDQSNLIQGLGGNDTLTLGAKGGFDILQGGTGNDVLRGDVNYGDILPSGSRVWDGGDGNDTLASWSFFGTGNDILIGGLGNDTLTASLYSPPGVDSEGYPVDEYYYGSGNDIVAFNKGDGNDRLVSANGSLTVSLGKLTNYSDLSFSKVANDLVLKVGGTDSLTFADWYKSSPGYNLKTVQNLQVIAEAMTGFALGGADALRNNKIENFNFAAMVTDFDAAVAANAANATNWQVTDALLTAHLNTGSDTLAMGGDLAYQYGKNSNLTGMGLLNAQSVIGSANFGQYAQAVNDPSVWQAELVKLG